LPVSIILMDIQLSTFFQSVLNTLKPFANNFEIKGSSEDALLHHWIQAIAQDEPLIYLDIDKSRNLIAALKDAGLYTDIDDFSAKLKNVINFPCRPAASFRFIDLFAGIGGFRLALQQHGGFCAFSSEWDKSAQQTYLKNYGELPFGDITAFTGDDITDEQLDKLIPDHDVLAGGFPCQPFSHAGVSARNAVGKQHGFECNTQGTLFFDIMRITAVKRPKVLFLENVRNIESHEKGQTFKVIKESIEDLGYVFKHAIIDSSTLVPQRRVRCYMVCFRADLNINFEFPTFDGEPLPLKSILEESVDPKFTISDRLWQGHINRTERNLQRGTGFTAFTANIDKPSNTLVARYGKDGKECLIAQENKNPRFLTPRECARLQGYPENFIFPEAKTPAYKQFGNSVAVPVISKISKEIVDLIT
jgi:DNA (cytosine-5)-methyltransferase 1